MMKMPRADIHHSLNNAADDIAHVILAQAGKAPYLLKALKVIEQLRIALAGKEKPQNGV
jgi:hypothetical protein